MEVTLDMSFQNQPLVSVVIAFLNEERFLKEAIESVVKQGYGNWELLLVDDGSTDSSTSIALQYAANYHGKIIYCEHDGHTNKGLSASRNHGIKQAKGTLVALLDADDIWLPAKLLNQVNIFQQHPDIGMIAEASEYWYSWAAPGNKNMVIPVGQIQNKVYDAPTLVLELYPLGAGAAPCPSALILRKEVIENAGYFEESFIKEFGMYEDQAFLVKIYLHEKVYLSSDCNNLYRQRPESIVQTVRSAGKYDHVRKYFLNWLNNYLVEKQITDHAVKKLLEKALLRYRKPGLYFLKYVVAAKAIEFYNKAMPAVRQLIQKQFSSKK